MDVKVDRPNVQLSLKNISAQPLNISADELTERFIRGDVSRNTEGSGLGLSIAKDLVQLQGGEFRLYLDGDLFKVCLLYTSLSYQIVKVKQISKNTSFVHTFRTYSEKAYITI